MKLKGTRGMQNIPRIRISGGVYSRVYSDGLTVFSSRPKQPKTNDPQSQYNRDLMRVSAWLANLAIPIEVETAQHFAVNSNYTYKDALTAAQFGALFRINLADGTQYHPADHSYQGEPEPDTGMAAFTTIGSYLAAQGLPVANFPIAIPTGITEVLVIVNRCSGTVASDLGVQVSIDGGLNWKTGATDYARWPASGVPTTASQIRFGGTGSANFQSGVMWFPAIYVGNKATVALNVPYGVDSGAYIATNDPVTAIRVMRSAGNLSGDSAMFILVLGR